MGFGAVQRGPQLAVHLARETVEGVRAVERDKGDGATLFVEHGAARGGCVHGCLSPGAIVPQRWWWNGNGNLPLTDPSVG
ncbi:hypothetical protein FQZ97_1067400 [compost metagenome]